MIVAYTPDRGLDYGIYASNGLSVSTSSHPRQRDPGIAFAHGFGDQDLNCILKSDGSGGAFLDYDGDGDLDLYVVNGAYLPGISSPYPEGRDPKKDLDYCLYRSNGDGTFTDVTQQAGVGDSGYGLGVVAGDYDNDGYPDLFVANYGPNVLYHNDGDVDIFTNNLNGPAVLLRNDGGNRNHWIKVKLVGGAREVQGPKSKVQSPRPGFGLGTIKPGRHRGAAHGGGRNAQADHGGQGRLGLSRFQRPWVALWIVHKRQSRPPGDMVAQRHLADPQTHSGGPDPCGA